MLGLPSFRRAPCQGGLRIYFQSHFFFPALTRASLNASFVGRTSAGGKIFMSSPNVRKITNCFKALFYVPFVSFICFLAARHFSASFMTEEGFLNLFTVLFIN